MTHLVAHFSDQGSAMAAMQKLASLGVPQSGIVAIHDGAVRGSPGSTNAPANVVSSLDHRADRPTEGWPAGRRVDEAGPAALGETRVELETDDCDLDEAAIRDVLEGAGVYRIDVSATPMPEETADVWPAPPRGDAVDVERAIEAARRGTEDDDPVTPAPGEGPSVRTRHDPHR